MNLPRNNTCGMAVCQVLYEHGGPMTMDSLHRALPGKTERSIEDALLAGTDKGYLIDMDGIFALSLLARRHFDQCVALARPPSARHDNVVLPRAPKPFTPLAYKTSRYGLREGSNDYLAWKSRQT